MTQFAFVFDLEGVLVDHMERQCEVASKALASVGLDVHVVAEMYQLRSEGEFHITRDFLSGLYVMHKEGVGLKQAKRDPKIVELKRQGLNENEWQLIDEAVRRFDILRTEGVLETDGKRYVIEANEPLLQGIREMLDKAKGRGDRLAMVTAGKKVDADGFMREAGILEYFDSDFLFYGEDKVKKEGMFRQVSEMLEERFGIAKSNQFVVEDSLSGIRDANANGLRSVLVLSGNTGLERARRLLPEERPTFILDSAKDLTNALMATHRREQGKRVHA